METSTASREELVALIAEQRVVIERLQARVREFEGGAGKIRGLAGNKIEPKKPGNPSAEKEPRKKRQHNFVRCDDEVCSRVEVHRGLLRKQVLYVPYSGIADVSGDTVTLSVNESGVQSKNWAARPRWIPDTAR